MHAAQDCRCSICAQVHGNHSLGYQLKLNARERNNLDSRIHRLGERVTLVPGDLVLDNHQRQGIVIQRIEPPDRDWLSIQSDRRIRELRFSGHWWQVLPLSGGSVSIPESLAVRVRASTLDDALRLVWKSDRYTASIVSRTLSTVFPNLPAALNTPNHTLGMLDYDESWGAVEVSHEDVVYDDWCRSMRTIARRYLQTQDILHGEVGEEPAWDAAPNVAVFAIESPMFKGWVGWWVICGSSLPQDFLSAGTIKHPYDALQEFHNRWRDLISCVLNNGKKRDVSIDQSSNVGQVVKCLERKTRLMSGWLRDSSLWTDM